MGLPNYYHCMLAMCFSLFLFFSIFRLFVQDFTVKLVVDAEQTLYPLQMVPRVLIKRCGCSSIYVNVCVLFYVGCFTMCACLCVCLCVCACECVCVCVYITSMYLHNMCIVYISLSSLTYVYTYVCIIRMLYTYTHIVYGPYLSDVV